MSMSFLGGSSSRMLVAGRFRGTVSASLSTLPTSCTSHCTAPVSGGIIRFKRRPSPTHNVPCTMVSLQYGMPKWFSTAPETQSSQDDTTGMKHPGNPIAESSKTTPPMPPPTADGEKKVFSPRINNIVEEIANLTLGEVADLNDALKERLNLPDVSAMPMGMQMMAMPGAAASEDSAMEDTGLPKKTSFGVKLLSFADDKKIALIKEIKNNVTGFNLVQAKKFVESLPQIVKNDMGKDEAEKLQKALEEAGGTCEID